MGGPEGGYVLCIHGGKGHYVSNYLGRQITVITSADPIPCGQVIIRVDFTKTREHGGTARITINGQASEPVDIPAINPVSFDARGAEFCIGADPIGVWAHYTPPFGFTGHIHHVRITRDGPEHHDTAADLRAAMDEQ